MGATLSIPDTYACRGVEIFRAGEWVDSSGKSTKYSDSDLRDIVRNSRRDGIPLKIGHGPTDGSGPACGWVENLRVENGSLMCDFTKLQSWVYVSLQTGEYRKRSCEIWSTDKGYELAAVALIGNWQSALPLADIFSKRVESGREVFCFTAALKIQKSEGEKAMSKFDASVRERVDTYMAANRFDDRDKAENFVRNELRREQWTDADTARVVAYCKKNGLDESDAGDFAAATTAILNNEDVPNMERYFPVGDFALAREIKTDTATAYGEAVHALLSAAGLDVRGDRDIVESVAGKKRLCEKVIGELKTALVALEKEISDLWGASKPVPSDLIDRRENLIAAIANNEVLLGELNKQA